MKKRVVVLLALTLAPALPSAAQQRAIPFWDDRVVAAIHAEVDGVAALETIRELGRFHRVQGSPGFAAAADVDATGTAFAVVLSTSLSDHVHRGAPVRFIRRGRYSLYRSSDGSWYLGYRRCNAMGPSVCGAIQPLSGPYRAYSSNPRSTGLLFEFFDGSGAHLPPGSSSLPLARVDITARSESRQRIAIEGRSWMPADSATVSIAVRNRGQ